MLKSLFDWLKTSLRMLDPFVFERYLRLKIITQSICYNVKKKHWNQKSKKAEKINDKEVQAIKSGSYINKQTKLPSQRVKIICDAKK
jgi:hypothetical protein